MDDLRKISPVPSVRPAGPTTPVRTLGDTTPPAANDQKAERSDQKPEKAGKSSAAAPSKPTASAKLTLKLKPSASFGALDLPPGRQGERYERVTLTASGGAEPYRFRFTTSEADRKLERGAPPPGLRISEDGVLTGDLKMGGRFRFTVEVEDANGEIGRADYLIPVKLDLERYKCAFDPATVEGVKKKRRAISYFDPSETDIDDQPVYPLSLTEFLAYKSAQAYLGNDPLDPKNSLEREIKRADTAGATSHFAFFDSNRSLRRYGEKALQGRRTAPLNKAPEHWEEFDRAKVERLNEWRAGLDAQAYGFVFEGRAFIICRGATSLRDWRVEVDNALTTDEPQPATWWENVKFRTGLRGKKINLSETEQTLIGGPDPEKYLRPARAVGFTAAWAAIRDQIENWLTTLPKQSRREFVFSGHGMGGAMAIIGAQEFAEKHGRKIHAVITFGAPCVGKSSSSASDDDTSIPAADHFADNYARQMKGELERRTIRVETESDALPKLMLLKGFAHVGRRWELEFEALPSPATLFTRRYITGPLLWLARGALGYEQTDLSVLPRKSLGYVAFASLPFVSSAIGGQAALSRYANYLSTLTYRKIRMARLGRLDDEELLELLSTSTAGSLDAYYLANTLYDQHLTRIYAPKPMRRFSPQFICDGKTEAALAQRYYGPQKARYMF